MIGVGHLITWIALAYFWNWSYLLYSALILFWVVGAALEWDFRVLFQLATLFVLLRPVAAIAVGMLLILLAIVAIVALICINFRQIFQFTLFCMAMTFAGFLFVLSWSLAINGSTVARKVWNIFTQSFVQVRADRAAVLFDWGDRPRVGETSKFRIMVLDDAGVDDKRSFLEGLKIEINRLNFSFGDPDSRIQFVNEYEESDEGCSLVINFSVRKSGDYQFRILDGGRHVRGSPTTQKFSPSDLDPETTSLQRPNRCVLFTRDECSHFYVQPRDKFENSCAVPGSDLAKFDFEFEYLDTDYSSICEYRFAQGGVGNSVRFSVTFMQVGMFQGRISYNGKTIQQGKFDIIVMSKDEVRTLQEMLKKDTNWIYHEARLLGIGSQLKKGKGSKIYIYVGSKQFSVREYVWKYIPIRVATFRVTPITKISILEADVNSTTHTISISDGFQKVVVKMDSVVARRVVALFSHFIKQRIGGSASTFAAKQDFFYSELRALQTNFRLSMSLLSIKRDDLINSSISETKWYSGKDWYKNFRIEFRGEPGIDAGGLRREWLELLCVQCFGSNPKGLFTPLGNSRLVHPNPADKRDPKWTLKHYELAGKIVGKCLFESAIGSSHKQMVNGRFSRSFLAQVVGLRPNFKHFEQDDPELYLQKVKYILENDVEAMDLTFTEEEYVSGRLVKTVDLIPNGSKLKVSEENKEDYLQELANYKLGTRVKEEIEAFSKGLHDLVPDELLINFDENELEMLWCGKSRFDVDDLRENFLKGGWSGIDPAYGRVLDWFWLAVTGFSDDEKARLLQFTTGSSLLPHGGFRELNPKFQISLSPDFGRLPVAHTCINEICLSDNSTFEKFEKCLKTAINEGSQGFGFR